MLLIALAGLAAAAAPANVDLNDLDRWENAADAFQDGPPGCWEVVGQASWNWDGGALGGSRGDAVFASRLVDGVWGPFHVEPLGEVQWERKKAAQKVYEYETRWVPMFGEIDEYEVSNDRRDVHLPIDDAVNTNPRLRKIEARQDARAERRRAREEERGDARDEEEGPRNVLREVIDELTGTAAVTSWTQWDEEQQAVVLSRSLPLEGAGKQAEQLIRFPSGGPPTSMTIAFPESWYRGTLPRFRVSDAVIELRVRPSGGKLFPTMEALRGTIGAFGFTFEMAQTIRYTSITPCASEPAEPGPEMVFPTYGPEESLDGEPPG